MIYRVSKEKAQLKTILPLLLRGVTSYNIANAFYYLVLGHCV